MTIPSVMIIELWELNIEGVNESGPTQKLGTCSTMSGMSNFLNPLQAVKTLATCMLD